ncbi:MAG: hypothetical protein IJE90_05040 [Clostridia bacterium]|nr:hypothetical protein [Clostridia bacterium]
MKKKLLTALTLTLCLLVLCCACGKDKQPATDGITPPNNTQNTTPPDDTQNTTPPAGTADDNKAPALPVTPDPQPPVQDEPKQPEQVEYVEVYRHPDNEKALRAYYDFWKNNGKAFSVDINKEITFAERNEIVKYAGVSKFGFADFGSDGIQEMVFMGSNGYFVLFWENDKLYIDHVIIRAISGINYNGLNVDAFNYNMATEYKTVYTLETFSAKNGMESLTLCYQINRQVINSSSYYIIRDQVNGEWIDRANTEVTKDEYDAYLKQYHNAPEIEQHSASMTCDYDSFCYYSRIKVPKDLRWLPFPGEPVKPYENPVPTFIALSDFNKTAMQNYYAFLTGEAVAYDILCQKMVSYNDMIKNGESKLTHFSLVDYGRDGVLEVWLRHENTVLSRDGNEYTAQILFFENGNLYVDYISHKFTHQTYDGLIDRYDGDGGYIYEVITVSAREGIQRQTIAKVFNTGLHSRDYYITASCENGKYTAAEERKCNYEEFWKFISPIENGFSRRTMDYSIDNIRKVFLSVK